MMAEADQTNRHFKGQHSTEVVEVFCRKHWIVLMGDFLGFFLFLGLLTLTLIYFKPIYNFFIQDSLVINLLAFGIIGLSTFYIHRFFLKMIQYFLQIMIITNYRIVILKKSLYLKDSKDAIDLSKIQNIIKHQDGILRNILRFGDLEITLSSSSTTKILKSIPNPDYHFRKINKVKSQYLNETLKLQQKRKENLSVNTNTISLEDHAFAGKDSIG